LYLLVIFFFFSFFFKVFSFWFCLLNGNHSYQDEAKNGNCGTTISDVNHISCSTLWNIKVMGLGQGYSFLFFQFSDMGHLANFSPKN